MPRLVHVSRSGETKALLASVPRGGSIVVPSLRRARAMYHSAARIGRRISIAQVEKGKPAQHVTVL